MEEVKDVPLVDVILVRLGVSQQKERKHVTGRRHQVPRSSGAGSKECKEEQG
jgi:hypothetical protein